VALLTLHSKFNKIVGAKLPIYKILSLGNDKKYIPAQSAEKTKFCQTPFVHKGTFCEEIE
jgi:hypothetical protein